MIDWTVRVGHGWLDQAPPEINTVHRLHADQGKLGVVTLQTHAHLEGARRSGDLPFYGSAQDIDTAGLLFKIVGDFLACLGREDLDVVSLIFVNFQPQTFSLSARPDPDGWNKKISIFFDGLR